MASCWVRMVGLGIANSSRSQKGQGAQRSAAANQAEVGREAQRRSAGRPQPNTELTAGNADDSDLFFCIRVIRVIRGKEWFCDGNAAAVSRIWQAADPIEIRANSGHGVREGDAAGRSGGGADGREVRQRRGPLDNIAQPWIGVVSKPELSW